VHGPAAGGDGDEAPWNPARPCGKLVGVSLFWRVFLINAGLLVLAAVLLALSPATVSQELALVEAGVLAAGVVAVLVVNLLLLRRAFEPLERLARLMRRVDPLEPGRRLEVTGPLPEVSAVGRAFNDMLDRLEAERRESGRRALAAQEGERRRVARELHDEVGQTLTAVVLQLETLARLAPDELREQVLMLRETAREGVEDVREIARGLRPEALEEFGLRPALVALASSFADRAGLRVQRQIAADLPALGPEEELVIYRVAQESLTNVARHAGAHRVQLGLEQRDGVVVLRVRDDGLGFDPGTATDGSGLQGMRERAMLVGGTLSLARVRPHGTEVTLEVPAPSSP
jgi:two-component system sensor histidine kinase UhpB